MTERWCWLCDDPDSCEMCSREALDLEGTGQAVLDRQTGGITVTKKGNRPLRISSTSANLTDWHTEAVDQLNKGIKDAVFSAAECVLDNIFDKDPGSCGTVFVTAPAIFGEPTERPLDIDFAVYVDDSADEPTWLFRANLQDIVAEEISDANDKDVAERLMKFSAALSALATKISCAVAANRRQ